MAMDLKEVAKSLPPEALPVLEKAGYFEPDSLEVGSMTTALTLTSREDGTPITIGGGSGERPSVLIFGSYT